MSSPANISVVLADFQYLTRKAIKSLINELSGFEFLAQIDNPEDLKEKIAALKPDLLVLDIFEDDPNYLDKIDEIRTEYCMPVLIITNTKNHDTIQSLLNAGIKGIVTKNCSEGEIINALKTVSIGNRFYCNSILNMVMGDDTKAKEVCTPLSQRELQVLRLIAAGNTTQEIASTLYVSVHTVNSHRKNILRKLNISSPIQLVVYAVENGLVQIDDNKTN